MGAVAARLKNTFSTHCHAAVSNATKSQLGSVCPPVRRCVALLLLRFWVPPPCRFGSMCEHTFCFVLVISSGDLNKVGKMCQK